MRIPVFVKSLIPVLLLSAVACSPQAIDRKALVDRNAPRVASFDSLASLSVGNGRFAMTVDVTGMQTFPERYALGLPLGTQSEWGWHCFDNPENLTHEITLVDLNFRGREEPYSLQSSSKERFLDPVGAVIGPDGKESYPDDGMEPQKFKEAVAWFRVNPHRLHLGCVGLELTNEDGSKATPEQITGIDQSLDLWHGVIRSAFSVNGQPFHVQTVCHPESDRMAWRIISPALKSGRTGVNFRFPYPTGAHSDDACDWNSPGKHTTVLTNVTENGATLERILGQTRYCLTVSWSQPAAIKETAPHYFVLTPLPGYDQFDIVCDFAPVQTQQQERFDAVASASADHWQHFWSTGGAVDFSRCTDIRAKELERRVVLSLYLMAINCAGTTPPQESGLTYNTWYGRPHLEMHWWHAAHNQLWGRPQLMQRSMEWYLDVALPVARQIAERQGYKGIRWMKMTDPWANEAPSDIGPLLIWQQPHFIYFAEQLYRACKEKGDEQGAQQIVEKYGDAVIETAAFIADFPDYDAPNDRYILQGFIPAQETLRTYEATNAPFELSYWHFSLGLAQQWRERMGLEHEPAWEEIRNKLSHLAERDGLYLAAEAAPQTYHDERFTSDHMAVLGAIGVLPESPLANPRIMENTLDWIMRNWNWDRTWGWDYPMTAMCAARLGRPETALDALLMDVQRNTYLVNGHNFQDARLRVYLPGNGGLLTTVAMMCAGWDGAPDISNPGFPRDWDVRWEGLSPMM